MTRKKLTPDRTLPASASIVDLARIVAAMLREQIPDLSADEEWACLMLGDPQFSAGHMVFLWMLRIAFQHGKIISHEEDAAGNLTHITLCDASEMSGGGVEQLDAQTGEGGDHL